MVTPLCEYKHTNLAARTVLANLPEPVAQDEEACYMDVEENPVRGIPSRRLRF